MLVTFDLCLSGAYIAGYLDPVDMCNTSTISKCPATPRRAPPACLSPPRVRCARYVTLSTGRGFLHLPELDVERIVEISDVFPTTARLRPGYSTTTWRFTKPSPIIDNKRSWCQAPIKPTNPVIGCFSESRFLSDFIVFFPIRRKFRCHLTDNADAQKVCKQTDFRIDKFEMCSFSGVVPKWPPSGIVGLCYISRNAPNDRTYRRKTVHNGILWDEYNLCLWEFFVCFSRSSSPPVNAIILWLFTANNDKVVCCFALLCFYIVQRVCLIAVIFINTSLCNEIIFQTRYNENFMLVMEH